MQCGEDGVGRRGVDRLRTERHSGRAFGIAMDGKTTALEAEVWIETVTECGRSFMAVWRKEELDMARHRQENREATILGKLL